ncbi:putative sugar transferase [Deferribacterales bacterium]|nr:putative sugar transferase [Deferribacterales bacterium]
MLRSVVLAFVIALAVVSLGKMSDSVSRLLLCVLFAVLFVFITIMRIIIKLLLAKTNYFQKNTLLIGDEKRLERVHKIFTDASGYMGLRIVKQEVLSDRLNVETLDNLIDDNNIQLAIMVPADIQTATEHKLLKHIHTRVVSVIYVPVPDVLDMTNAEAGQLLNGQLGYLYINNLIISPVNIILKRIFDIVVSLLLLPLVLLVCLPLCVAIYMLYGTFPVFRHERIGHGGKLFKIYKLRSMYGDAEARLITLLANDENMCKEWNETYKLKNDPRATPLGRFLRKTSIDELPQIINVLLGEMSIVGPRPVLTEELEKYYGEDKVYYKMTYPGITGLWQVSGRNDTSYAERIAIDNWYAFNWSVWLDVTILLYTPYIVFFRRGAY